MSEQALSYYSIF